MLLVESYVASNILSNTITTPSSDSSLLVNKIRTFSESSPTEYHVNSIKQIWFNKLVTFIEEENLVLELSNWAESKAKQSRLFDFWYFMLRHLFEPLMILYCSIRTSNFKSRNACVARIAPLFFSSNHRNYARLCAQHLYDLSNASPYLLNRLSKSFSVVRTERPFSNIALDQTIESSINKYGKSHGGISGKFTNDTIDVWTNSFADRATLSSILHEIYEVETHANSLDSHIESTPERQMKDNKDLRIILMKLKQEEIFSSNAPQFRKLFSGKIIHDDIINSITSSFVRGEEAMRSYIVDRLINKTIKIDEPLTTMTFLKLSDADHYVPGERPNTKKKNLLNTHSRDLSKNLNSIDRLMRDAVIVAEQRNITLSSVFSHEFTIAPLSLCDLRDNNIMYQQNKSSIIDYIKSQFSTSFSSSPPSIHETQALIIDGRSILQIKPVGKRVTVRQYANQLLKMIIVYNFNSFNRIDVVFDSPSYDLKCDDVFDSDYHQLVMNNEAIIASRIRECWSASTSIQALPDGKVLVIAGPDESSVTLKKYCDPINDYLLVSNHAEAATRLFIHAQAISYENIKSIVCQSYDTDVIILGIAHALSLDVNNFFIKSFNTKGKFYTYINIREIALAIKKKFLIDPIILLVIHALSGCDTTSFIRNISKTNMFRTFLSNTSRYSNLNHLFSVPLSMDGISCAERLLLDCYSYTNTASSLDDLRATVASSSFKQNRASFVAPTLPPTSDAFYFHCQRAARQIQIWSQNSISTSRPLSQPVTSTPQKLKFTTITSRRAMTQENATTYEDISIVSFSPFQYSFHKLMSRQFDVNNSDAEDANAANSSHILYQLLVDWYGTTKLNRSLSSTQLADQWITLWFAKREQQKLADQKLMKYHSAIEYFIHFQPKTLKEKMAMIILYDQITRNIFRGTENAYKYDDIARRIALNLVETTCLSTLPIQFLLTILICIIHSEQIEHLDLVKSLIQQYLVRHPSIDPNLLTSLNGIVKNHYDRIQLFGRIPERNCFIGRQSTLAEISFMKAVNTKEMF
ncbi:unnamed protein product [Rotaria sp. Silwood1]|nr:unnamed protein product [Rotaria sp. Silwood1]